MSEPFAPFSRPLYVMAKAAGSMCNLRCQYCYYLEKSKFYPAKNNGGGARHFMSDAVLEEFIRQYIEAQTAPSVMFTWHGGESLMRDVNFYRKVLDIQRKYARRGIRIDNCIQTNGTMLTDEWCRFFKDNGWLVGLSVDGPREFHDYYRRTPSGAGSFDDVMHGVELLNRHGVEWNAMAVVNDLNVARPLEFYRFFKDIDCRFIQFTPIVERMTGHGLASASDRNSLQPAPFSVGPQAWGDFLCAIFDEWVCNDVGSVFIQLFDATLANTVGIEPGVCSMARTCGHAAVIEHNGDLYSCDHFVFPEYRLGNIRRKTIFEMMNSPEQQKFGQDKRASLPGQCRRCQWLHLCNGECPKNRFAVTPDGEPGLNYLCEGYRRFFEHTASAMNYMRGELLAGRSPATVMKLYR